MAFDGSSGRHSGVRFPWTLIAGRGAQGSATLDPSVLVKLWLSLHDDLATSLGLPYSHRTFIAGLKTQETAILGLFRVGEASAEPLRRSLLTPLGVTLVCFRRSSASLAAVLLSPSGDTRRLLRPSC